MAFLEKLPKNITLENQLYELFLRIARRSGNSSSKSGASKASSPPRGAGKLSHSLQIGLEDGAKHSLGYPILVVDRKGLISQVNQANFDLSTIIRVDGTGTVHHRDPFFDCPAGARANLDLEAGRDFESKPRGDKHPLSRLEHEGLGELRAQVETAGMLRFIGRELPAEIFEFLHTHADLLHQGPLYKLHLKRGLR
jgi:hypothetical protein